MFDFLNTPNLAIMQKSLDALWQRQTITAENITNHDTPNYKAKRLVFEDIMADKISQIKNHNIKNGYIKHQMVQEINSVQSRVVTDKTTEMRADGNNVDIDHENVELARTKLQYDYMIRKITDEYNLLKKAVTEGRG